jgi:hypothetical protein
MASVVLASSSKSCRTVLTQPLDSIKREYRTNLRKMRMEAAISGWRDGDARPLVQHLKTAHNKNL